MPSTMQAYSQLLREMENCNMEDPMENPIVWLYKLNSINCRMGEIDASYRKLDIQMIVFITSKLPRGHYQPLIMAYSLNGFAGVTLPAFQKKVIKFWQSSIKPRFTETNVTMAATQYGSLTNQVQTVSNKNNDKDNKMNELMDLLCQMMATQASTSTGDHKPPPAMNNAPGKATMCSNCNKPGHSIINC